MNARLSLVIAETFNVPADAVRPDASAKTVPAWDSLGHLTLVAALEKAFGASFTMDEILAMENAGGIERLLRDKGLLGA